LKYEKGENFLENIESFADSADLTYSKFKFEPLPDLLQIANSRFSITPQILELYRPAGSLKGIIISNMTKCIRNGIL
jgi:hypothetical protein